MPRSTVHGAEGTEEKIRLLQKIITMLDVIILLVALSIMHAMLKDSAITKIANTNNVSEMITIRKNFNRNVRVAAIIILLIFWTYIFINCIDNGHMYIWSIALNTGFCAFYIFKDNLHPIYIKTDQDIRCKNYIMYLRGFSTDIYNNSDKKQKGFNEIKMYNALLIHCTSNVIAIGKPKELFSPRGCERFYCEEKTWKDSLIKFVEKSIANVILLHDSQNCLYELYQCIAYKNKTYCVVAELSVYNRIREFVGDDIGLPEISEEKPFFFRLDKPEEIILYDDIAFAEKIQSDIILDENNEYSDVVKKYIEELRVKRKKYKESAILKLIRIITLLAIITLFAYLDGYFD